MFCPNCGKKLEDEMRFCTECGTPMPASDVLRSEDDAVNTEASVDEVQVSQVSSEEASASEVAEGVSGEENELTVDAIEVMATDQIEQSAEDGEGTKTAEVTQIQQVSTNTEDAPAAEVTEIRPDSALPDSELKPQMPQQPAPAAYTPASTSAMPQVAAAVPAGGAGAAAMVAAPVQNNRLRTILISIIAVAVVVIVAVVLFASGRLGGSQPITAEAIPNSIIRTAVLDQLDTNGDGMLSSEETANVTALVYTPEGAKFIREGEEFNVSAIKQEIKDKAAQKGNGGSASDEASGNDGSGDGAVEKQDTSIPSIVPGLKKLVASGAGLTEIDLSQWPELEYVDLQDNLLTTLDLASNESIGVLYCDPEVVLTGLDEAGLYFTDLITSVTTTNSYMSGPITIEYDENARPVYADGFTYAYDEQGRLIETVQEGDGEGAWYRSYSYGSNGLLSCSKNFTPLDVSAMSMDEYYGYDADGNLTQHVSTRGTEIDYAQIFEYENGNVVNCKATNGAAIYDHDEEGKISSVFLSSGSSQKMLEYTYYEGALSSYSIDDLSDSGRTSSLVTSYGQDLIPAASTSSEGSSSYDITYDCNADGYITNITWNNAGISSTVLSGDSATITYIKRVGSLEDRPAERFVPVFRVAAYEELLPGMYWSLIDDWYSSTGDNNPVSILSWGPIQTMTDHMGITSLMPTNANELKLAQYDEEHWSDGLDLSSEQPVDSVYQSVLDQATQASLPVSPAEFTKNETYGAIVNEYVDFVDTINSGSHGGSEVLEATYPDIPFDVIFDYATYGSASVPLLCSYVDLNDDGIDELAIVLTDDSGESSNSGYFTALYAKVGSEVKLVDFSRQRDLRFLASGDYILSQGSGGAVTGAYIYSRWDGSGLIEVSEFEFDGAFIDDFEFGEMYRVFTRNEAGQENEQIVDPSECEDMRAAFLNEHPQMQVGWTRIR